MMPVVRALVLLIVIVVILMVACIILAGRAARDRRIATAERRAVEQRIHDVNTMNAYHHRRNVR